MRRNLGVLFVWGISALVLILALSAKANAAWADWYINTYEFEDGYYYAGAHEYLDCNFVSGSTCQAYGGGEITTGNKHDWTSQARDKEANIGWIFDAEQPHWDISAEGQMRVSAKGLCDDWFEDAYWARSRAWVGADGDLMFCDGFEAEVSNKETAGNYTWSVTIGSTTYTLNGTRINEGREWKIGDLVEDEASLDTSVTAFSYESGVQMALHGDTDTDEVSGTCNENDPSSGYGHCFGYAVATDGDTILLRKSLD